MKKRPRETHCAYCGESVRGKSYFPVDGFRLCVMHASSDEPRCGDIFLSASFEAHRNRIPKLPKETRETNP